MKTIRFKQPDHLKNIFYIDTKKLTKKTFEIILNNLKNYQYARIIELQNI